MFNQLFVEEQNSGLVCFLLAPFPAYFSFILVFDSQFKANAMFN